MRARRSEPQRRASGEARAAQLLMYRRLESRASGESRAAGGGTTAKHVKHTAERRAAERAVAGHAAQDHCESGGAGRQGSGRC